MKPRHRLSDTPLAALRLLVCALLLPLVVSAQSESTGTIEGRVLNGDTGKFLGKALVTVVDSAASTLTNDFGEYSLRNLPAGPVTLRFSHTGKPSQEIPVVVNAGGTVVQNATIGGKGPAGDGTVVLDPFTVESVRFRNAADIAINEERYSVNIKSVVAADAFGDIAQGNVGEFVKFLPGVELDYGGTYTSPSDASGISVRGFGAADTLIYVDGVPISSASPASLSNAVGLDMMSINNASRVEIIKVPTPDMPSNSIGGQINLISKSAFEYTKPTFSFRTYMTVNSENLDLFKKVAGPSNKTYYSSLPGADFTYAHPFSEKFGISFTGSHYEEFTAQRRFRPEWGTTNITGVDLRAFGGAASATLANGAGPVSLVNPYLTRISVTDSPRWQRRDSVSLKADWKPLAGLTVTGSYQYSLYDSADAARRLQFRIQRPQTWDGTQASSYPYLTAQQSVAQGGPNAIFNPNSTLDMNIDSRDKLGDTHTAYGRVMYQRGAWDIYAQASVSSSTGSYKDIENGHFSTVDVSSTVGRMTFTNVADGLPGQVAVLTREGAPFNYSSLANWNVPTIQARSGKAESLNDIFTYRLDVRRELDFLPRRWVSLAAKAGFLRTDKLDKKWGLGTGWRQTYVGPALTVADYVDQTYTGASPGWVFPAQEWISTYRLYDLYAKNPTYFNADSDSDQVNNWNSTVNQNKRIRDVSDAWYFQIEGKTLRNRLSFVAGLREENSTRTGRGPLTDNDWNFVKNADGTLYRNVTLAGGNGLVAINSATSPLFATSTVGTALRSDLQAKGITFPSAPIVSNTLAARKLQLRPLQEVRGESKGKPSYTIATSYDITSKVVGKLSYSRTFGRIDLENGTSGLLSASNAYTLNENDSSTAIPRGVITVANPNLMPWISDNWDASMIYYTDSGGKFGLTYFIKDVSNFQETFITSSTDPNFAVVLDSLGLDASSYPDWELRTTLNGIGTSKTEGWELELSQDFRALSFIGNLGNWGQRLYGFANYSSKKRKQANALLSARPAADDTASAGLQLATRRFSAMIKATWTDLKFISATNVTYNGTNYPLGTYAPSVTKVDANVNFQLTRRWSLFASARDIFNTGDVRKRFEINSNLYPAYSAWDDLREYGVSINFGVRGNF
jgi:iron complex outermembrane recepter protein